MYSFSWFQNAEAKNTRGINLTANSYFFISAYDENLLKKIIKGIINGPSVCFGISVSDVQIVEEPKFSNREVFPVASPVFIKRRFDDKEKHITSDDVRVSFDSTYAAPKTKIIRYKEVGNRVNMCPVIIEGTHEQIAFAWNVGVGNSTGIGFGALK
jgi:CRISPR-associated endoribonuclease Cas6